MTSSDRVVQAPAVVQQVAEVAWVVVETASQGFTTTADDIVDSRPWEKTDFAHRLPHLAAAEAAKLAEKIRLEIGLTGAVQTPREWMIDDVSRDWSQIEQENQDHFLAGAMQLAIALLSAAASTDAGPVAAEMYLRILIRSLERNVLPELEPSLPQLFDQVFGAATGDAYANLRDTFITATRRMAEEGKWDAHWAFLRIYILSVLPRDRQRASASSERQVEAGLDVQCF